MKLKYKIGDVVILSVCEINSEKPELVKIIDVEDITGLFDYEIEYLKNGEVTLVWESELYPTINPNDVIKEMIGESKV